MQLEHLATRGFRNLEPIDLEFPARFIVLHGQNAQGKTNALESIYLLATLKPLRARRNQELVRWGAEQATVAGRVGHEGISRRYRVDLGREGREVRLDGKRLSDIGEYFEGIRAIAFAPADAAIVTGEPKIRRQWLDRAAFTAAPAHLEAVRRYRRLLSQKVAALHGDRVDGTLLDVLDDQLARAGAELVERRVRVLAQLEPHVQTVHSEIAGGVGKLALRYQTDAKGEDLAARQQALRERLAAHRSDEVRRQRTLVGPQLDRVSITLDGRSTRTFGSQGQIRSVVLALKLGELVAARQRGSAPLFLIDDVSSELDAQRTAQLVRALEQLQVQVFATTTDVDYLASLPTSETLRIRVESGVLRPE